jgi:hypothetical protein
MPISAPDHSSDPAPKRMINVKVTNNNDTQFVDVYNGIRYTFGPKQSVSIPLAAATHIFGYQKTNCDTQMMFNHMCKRWGWNTPENVKDGFAKVKEIFGKFVFAPVVMKLVETSVIDTSVLADDREEAAGAKSTPFKLGKQAIGADEPLIA